MFPCPAKQDLRPVRFSRITNHRLCGLSHPESVAPGAAHALPFTPTQGGTKLSAKSLIQRDLRDIPAYSIAEAAGYLRIPKSTLRAWLLGQGTFKSVIEIADRKDRRLSFINLVEAFVLAGIRREHAIPLPKVRKAVGYLRRTFSTQRPLADEQFATDGIDLFVEKFGALVGATQEGQIQLREIILGQLKFIRRDPSGVPERIVLFPGNAKNNRSADVVIDPRRSFGRPVLEGIGVRTSILAERFKAGESIDELARDYDAAPEAIQNALRCELLAA